jgi:hypothetical protein
MFFTSWAIYKAYECFHDYRHFFTFNYLFFSFHNYHKWFNHAWTLILWMCFTSWLWDPSGVSLGCAFFTLIWKQSRVFHSFDLCSKSFIQVLKWWLFHFLLISMYDKSFNFFTLTSIVNGLFLCFSEVKQYIKYMNVSMICRYFSYLII